MKRHRTSLPRRGLTIVELMIGMLAGAILALTASIVLVQGFKVYARNTAAAELQRDGGIAIEMMQRRLREAASGDVSLLANGFRIDRPGVPAVSFESVVAGAVTNLVYDPNKSVGGDEIIVAEGTLASLTEGWLPSGAGLWVHLSLEGQARPGAESSGNRESVDLDAVIHFRN